MATVDLERLSKRYPGGALAVDRIDLNVSDQEFLVLVGPSGCGKSTTLRMIAGLETSTDGEIRIGGRVVNDVAPKDRDIAMVFQNYALYPHMSVYRNLSFGLSLRYGGGVLARGVRRLFQPHRAKELAQLRDGIEPQVRQTAKRLGIEHLLDRKPHQLSGGERQRVALGRAIVRNPAAFLFDEPLSNLDAKLRQKMRVELKRLHRELNATMIYVTHDQVEAMTLGDRVAVMNQGKLLQVGSPLEVYDRPGDLFVARFIGSVPMNLQAGVASSDGRNICFTGGAIKLEFEAQPEWHSQLLGSQTSGEVVLGFRAEDVQVWEANDGLERLVTGTVATLDRLGDASVAYFDSLSVCRQENLAEDGQTFDGLSYEETKQDGPGEMLVAKLASGTQLGTGDRLELAVDPTRLKWFDRQTGENLLKD